MGAPLGQSSSPRRISLGPTPDLPRCGCQTRRKPWTTCFGCSLGGLGNRKPHFLSSWTNFSLGFNPHNLRKTMVVNGGYMNPRCFNGGLNPRVFGKTTLDHPLGKCEGEAQFAAGVLLRIWPLSTFTRVNWPLLDACKSVVILSSRRGVRVPHVPDDRHLTCGCLAELYFSPRLMNSARVWAWKKVPSRVCFDR